MKLLAFCLLLGMSAQAQDPVYDISHLPKNWRFMGRDGSLLMTCDNPSGHPINCKLEPGKQLDDVADGWMGLQGAFFGQSTLPEAAQRAADETGPLGDGPNPPWPPNDPIDVPAVQEPNPQAGWCAKNMTNDVGLAYCHATVRDQETILTCADKSRILEHDENSPPKYWCRKVEF